MNEENQQTGVNATVKVENEKQLPALVLKMAEAVDMSPKQYFNTIKATCGLAEASYAQTMAFLLTAREYNLDPMVKQIYAFEKGGCIVPIVPIDGWLRIINNHLQFDGMEFQDFFGEDKKISHITCKLNRKDRKYPVIVTEYLSECQMQTDPWKKWPIRMLRHKATIQAARYAFGLGGIYDPDEGERIKASRTAEEVTHNVDQHLQEMGVDTRAPGDVAEMVDAEFLPVEEQELPQAQAEMDWDAIVDELTLGLVNTDSPIKMKLFLEENAELINRIGTQGPLRLKAKWVGLVEAQQTKFRKKA